MSATPIEQHPAQHAVSQTDRRHFLQGVSALAAIAAVPAMPAGA